MITRFIVLQNSISSLLNGGIEARVKMYESRRIDFEFDSKGQDSQFDSRSNLTFDRFESFKSSSNVIASQFFFFLASKETLSASRYRRTSRKKKRWFDVPPWRTRGGSRRNAIILLRKCVRVPPLFWRYTHASDCVRTRNSWQVSRNEQPT